MTDRLPIVTKDAKALVPGRKTFFSLSGELRNQIYSLALDQDYRVPLDPYYVNKPDPSAALLRTCSQAYQEARSYLVEKQVAYIPVMTGMQYNYGGELKEDYGLSKETTDTIAASLMEFMEVNFHLHIDLLPKQLHSPCCIDSNGEEWNPGALLYSLHQAIKQYTPHSSNQYLEHGLGKRRATVHLDHLLSLWPKISSEQPVVPICAMRDLVDLVAKDTMTEWQIQYYVPTGQSNAMSTYGYTNDEEMASLIRDTELAQLRSYATKCGHDNITIIAELYGEDTKWEYGDKSGSVTRQRSPATEFWPNMHFDPWRYRFDRGDHLQRSYPEHMPIENFEDEALAATQKDRLRREKWMKTKQWEDDLAKAERAEVAHRAVVERRAEMERQAERDRRADRERNRGFMGLDDKGA